HHVAHALGAELDDAADDRDLFVLADALELSFAQEIVQCFALDIDRGTSALPLEWRRGATPESNDRRDNELDESEHRYDDWNEVSRPLPRDRAREHLAGEDDECNEHGDIDEELRAAVFQAEHDSGEHQRERDSGAGADEQTVW